MIPVSNLISPNPSCSGYFCQQSNRQINKPLKMQQALSGSEFLGGLNFCDDPNNSDDPACAPLNLMNLQFDFCHYEIGDDYVTCVEEIPVLSKLQNLYQEIT